MAWNEPNDSGDKKKDPWGDKGRNQQSPPDLDEVLRKFQQKLGQLFGQGRSKGSGPDGAKGAYGFVIGLVVAVLVVIYALSGIYIVKEAEQAAVFTFGKYIKTVGAGPHWIAPIIQSKEVVDVSRIMSSTHVASMLTRDENIINISLSIQFRVANLRDYLFNVVSPIDSLQQATDSAMRQVIGHSSLDQALTDGREQIRQDIFTQLEQILGHYQAGILITDVALQPAEAPQEVRAAFDDAIKAQEDEQRTINEANAYENRIVPVAEGNAERMIAEARAYGQQVELEAQGEVARFLEVLPQFEAAPGVTRERLYLDAMESVLSNSSKIIVDSTGNNLLYLPLDNLGGQNSANNNESRMENAPPVPPETISMLSDNNRNAPRDFRGREAR